MPSCHIIEPIQEQSQEQYLNSINHMEGKIAKHEPKKKEISEHKMKIQNKIVFLMMVTTFVLAFLVISFFLLWLLILNSSQPAG